MANKDDACKPVVDLSQCTVCGTCVAACAEVFQINDAGFVEVTELAAYPVDDVEDAIMYCPEDCIYWEGECGSLEPDA